MVGRDADRLGALGQQNAVLVRLASGMAGDWGDLSASCRRITEEVGKTIGVERASVWLYWPAEGVLRLLDLYEAGPARHTSGLELKDRDYAPYFDWMRQERILVAHDAPRHPVAGVFAETYLRPLGITSMLDASIRAGGQLVGAVCLEHVGPAREWSPEEQAFAGSVADLVSMVIEAARRRQAEVDLDRQRAFLRSVIDLDPNLIFARADGRYTLVNLAFAALAGRDAPALEGAADAELGPPFAVFAIGDATVMAEKHEVVVGEQQVEDGSGRTRWLHVVKRPMLESDGRVSGVLGVATDITERKRAEEERLTLESTLRQSQRLESLGLLAGGVAHDFNNILTPILGYASFAMEGVPKTDPLRADLQAIKTAAERARDLTSQLLAFSRKQVLELRVVDLNRELQQTAKMLKRLLPENIRFDLDLDGGRLPVLADSTQLHQVFVNLAINARDAMPEGGSLTFRTRGQHGSPRDEVVVSVVDTGVGMSPRIMSRIFEPFFTTKERGRGTGLGLSTVYGIVQQHEARLSVESEPGHGTTFEIRFPWSSAAEADNEASRSGVFRVPGTGKVLVVEDDDLVRQLVCEILVDQGYTVTPAEDGEQALTLARAGGVDLLLTDVVLPGVDGRTLTRQLRQLHPHVRAVWMSGYPQDALPGVVLDEGVVFLRKPFSADDLGKKVREAMYT